MKGFSSYHPIILFIYFFVVLFVTMFTTSPILLAISLINGILLYTLESGWTKCAKVLGYGLTIGIIMVVTNMLFVHKGVTVLFYIGNSPVTLEAILYGVYMAVMLMCIFVWFASYNAIISEDKLTYLFGGVAPKLSLIFVMTLRYIPAVRRKWREIDNAQRTLGAYSGAGYYDKLKSKMQVFGALVSWSVESSIVTADSMRARGYGIAKRTNYHNFFWTLRDSVMMILIVAVGALLIGLVAYGVGKYSYYPSLQALDFSTLAITTYVAMFGMCLLPVIIEIKEVLLWQFLKSKI